MLGKRNILAISKEGLGLSIVSLNFLQNLLTHLQQNFEKSIPELAEQLTKDFSLIHKEVQAHASEIQLRISQIIKAKYF